MQGFKSFAERTNVEFGGGISAVVGPNGSGKSNLADALRWALGEQGRALRSRKAEDVIWAGSEKRTAQGMADVTLVLDNADGLLPVDFQVLEFGRRLYRSGENEYLLNKQRIRLRDLVDLLDAAHLADNAFLFIGQGMVDQALALRPEERRPLFEEVAGVRRHERRRRKAEEQLAESEANLARVDDILTELRPQARRLAAQAEQQTARSSIADELASALLASTHASMARGGGRLAVASERRITADGDATRAMADLTRPRPWPPALAGELSARADAERERRETHETARTALTELQLRDGRLGSELDAIERDRARLADERAAAEADAAEPATRRRRRPSRRAMSTSRRRSVTAERELAEALSELAALRSDSSARGEDAAAIRRAESARDAEAETARRRLAEAERQAVDRTLRRRSRRGEAGRGAHAFRGRASSARIRRGRGALRPDDRRDGTGIAPRTPRPSERAWRNASRRRRPRLPRSAVGRRHCETSSTRTSGDPSPGRPGRSVADAWTRTSSSIRSCEPLWRPHWQIAPVRTSWPSTESRTSSASVGVWWSRNGWPEAGTARTPRRGAGSTPSPVPAAAGSPSPCAATRRAASAACSIGRCGCPIWPRASTLQAQMPSGWAAVPRDGSAVVDDTGVALGASDGALERRAEHGRLSTDLKRIEGELAASAHRPMRPPCVRPRRASAFETARAESSRLAGDRRRMEEAERAAVRETEVATREASVAHRPAAATRRRGGATAGAAHPPNRLGHERDDRRARRQRQRSRPGRRVPTTCVNGATVSLRNLPNTTGRGATPSTPGARAEAAVTMAEERIARADREAAALVEREASLGTERDRLATDIAVASTRERDAREGLAALHSADAADRSRLAEAERDASVARERLRTADERVRAADHAELEARLGLESLRDGVLVELAGLGDLGFASLGIRRAPRSPDDAAIDGEPDAASTTPLPSSPR